MGQHPGRVLIVDDHPAHRRVVAFTLQEAGFDVTAADDAAGALEAARQQHFDVVVTDYFMPGQTGADLARSLRQTDGYAETPIILLTARAAELDLSNLASSLSLLIMSKSCSLKRLVGMVAGCLSGRVCPG
jgi:CheY-like chemotaxis protein